METRSQSTSIKPAEAALILDTARHIIEQAGYTLAIVATGEQGAPNIALLQPDVIVIIAGGSEWLLFKAAQAESALPQPAIIHLCTDSHLGYEHFPPIDLVLPLHLNYIKTPLQNFLRLIQENTRLNRQQQANDLQVSALQDAIAQQKRATSEVEIYKNAIVRNISHELKTPLLQVKSAISLIKEDVPGSRLIDYAENATARLEALVKNITMLGSSLDANLSPLIMRDAVEYARHSLSRVWQHKDQIERIRIEIENDLPPVLADKQGLNTVLQLLMDNALKFSEKEVLVTARRLNQQAQIAVRDQGIGIAPEQLKSIFDLFYQVDNSSTRRYGGAGVGLALVKLILDNHHTSIQVESKPNKGSAFLFFLNFAEMTPVGQMR